MHASARFARISSKGSEVLAIANSATAGTKALLQLLQDAADRFTADQEVGGSILDAATATRLGLTPAQLQGAASFLADAGLIQLTGAETDADIP